MIDDIDLMYYMDSEKDDINSENEDNINSEKDDIRYFKHNITNIIYFLINYAIYNDKKMIIYKEILSLKNNIYINKKNFLNQCKLLTFKQLNEEILLLKDKNEKNDFNV